MQMLIFVFDVGSLSLKYYYHVEKCISVPLYYSLCSVSYIINSWLNVFKTADKRVVFLITYHY